MIAFTSYTQELHNYYGDCAVSLSNINGRLIQQYRACVVVLLGWELCHITVLCVQGLPILIVSFAFYNYNSVYLLGRKLNSMQNYKSIVTMVFECYFFNQLLHWISMACIIMYC